MKIKINIVLYVVLLISLSVGFGCRSNAFWKHEKLRIERAEKDLNYMELNSDINVKVLLFYTKYNYDLCFFPNFIVGTFNNDTIAILDKDYCGVISIHDIITVKPGNWNDEDKRKYRMPFIVTSSKKKNDLLVAVKEVYYGRIEKK